MDFRGNRERTLHEYQQSRAMRGDIVVILLVLILAGMWVYYLGVHGGIRSITGFSVLESGSATSATLVFENQSLPLGTLLEVTIGGKKYQKEASLLLPPPYEIFYENATVYGWNEPLAVDILALAPNLAPGTYNVDATLSVTSVLLAMKTTTLTVVADEETKQSAEPTPENSTLHKPVESLSFGSSPQETPPLEPFLSPSNGPVFFTQVAGEGARNWDANFTSSQTKADQFFAIASDTLGNIYAVGVGYNATDTCTSGVGQCDDMWVKKFSSAGAENTTAWNKTFVKGVATGVAVDNATNSVYVVGYYRGGFGNNDWWIQKFREDGTQNVTSWNFTFSGTGNADDRAQAVTVDSLGNVYVVGYGTNIATFSSSLDWWIKKFTETGTQNTSPWNINFTSGGSASDAALAVATDSNNNVYVAGYGTNINISSSGENWWVKKFTETGTENTSAWNITYTSPGSASDRPRGVAVDSNDIVYVVGYGYNATTNCGGSTKCKEWLLKSFREVGTENTTAWNITFNSNGSQNDEAAAIALDKTDNIYIAGFGYNTTGTCSGTSCEDWWVKKFSTAAVENTASWNLSFDGAASDQAFGVVADGIFNVTVAGYLINGTGNRDLWTIQLIGNSSGAGGGGDTTAPTVTFIDPPNAAVANFSDRVFNFTWNITDDLQTLMMCNLTILNSSGGADAYKIANRGANNGTLSNVSFSAGSFVNGTLNWTVNCSDGTNTGTAGTGRTFTVDLSAPTVNLMEPQNNTGFNTGTDAINFSFNTTDAQDNALNCNLTIGNGSDYKLTNFLTSGSGVANQSFYVDNFTNSTHNWTVNCTNDATGVTNGGTRFFTVDRTAPIVTLTAPADNSFYNFSTGELNFTWNVTDDINATVLCNLSIANGSENFKNSTVQSTNSTLSNISYLTNNFTNASHSWLVTCTDAGGNVGASTSRTFTVDQHPPAIILLAPTNNSLYNFTTGELNFTWNANDTLDATLSCNLTISNSSDYKIINVDAANGSLTNSSLFSGNFTESTHNWTVNCTDNAGGINASGTLFFSFDQTAPVLSNALPTNESVQAVNATIQLSINSTDNTTVSNVSVNITYPNGSVVQKSTDNPRSAFYNTSLLLQSLGVHNVTFVANDSTDHRQTLGINFNSTRIEVCDTLTASRNLTGSINATGSAVCILVNSTSNIVLDCNNFNITGDGTGIGVRVYNASNVNITNCGLQNFDKAMEFINATAAGVNNIIISNSTSKDIVVNQSTRPLITNTTAASTEIQDVTGFEVEKSQGKVTFLTSFNGSLGNISQLITFGDGEVFVNSTAAPSLNRSANITMTNLTRFIGRIIEVEVDFEDDSVFTTCLSPTCTIISFTDSTATLIFNVSRFSKYRVNEGSGSSIGGGDRGTRTIRGTTGAPAGSGGGGGSGGGPSGAPLQSAPPAPESAVSSSFLDALVSAPVQQELTRAVGEGVLEQFSTQLTPAEIRILPVPQGTNYAWLIPLLLPLLLAVTSLSVPTPRRVFCDEDTLYQLIRTKKISQYKKLYITQAMKQKADPENHYANLIPLPFSNNEKYLINYLCERSNASRAIVELLFAAQKKKHAKVITTASIPALLQARFKHLKIVSPAALEQTKASAFGRARPLFLHALPSMLAALRLKKQQPIDPSLLDYILTARTKGVVADEVAQRLVTTGWKPDMVRTALAQSDARLAALYNYVEQAKAKGLDDAQITERVVKQGWEPRAARAALQSIETAFSELLTYVRQAKSSGISPSDIINRLAAQGWEEKVASEEVRRFNAALSKLVSYINNARLHGLSNEEIQRRLVNFGWDREEVSEQLLLVQLRIEQLAQYIQQAKASGVSAGDILERLTALGWNKKEISSELKELEHNEKSLLSYLRRAKAQGVSDGEIKKRLLSEGWDLALIETDLRLVAGGMQRLIEYMSTAKQGGIGDETILNRLVSEGWEAEDVQHELERFKNAMDLLVQYITDAHLTGVSDSEIRRRLKETRWSIQDIAGAFQLAALSSPPADVADAAAAEAS